MALDFYSALDQMATPSVDLGGAPRADDAKALAQLILGGGRADVGGQQVLGVGGPISGQPAPMAPAPAPANSNLKSVLDTADQIAGSMGSGNSAASAITSTLLPNPYGRGSYDPNDPTQVAAVNAAGERQKQVQTGMDAIRQLQGEAPTLSIGHNLSPAELLAYKQGSENYQKRLDSSKGTVQSILESLGIGENDYTKAFNKEKGKQDAQGLGSNGSIDVTAKKLANYELPISALSRLPGPQRLAIINKAAEFDPNFDIKQYDTRQKVMNSFTSGKDKDNITRLNTAVDHLEKLKQAGDALQNGDLRIANAIKNGLSNATGDPKVKAYLDAANAVAGELATVFKNGTGTDIEINKWKDNLSAADSPRQIQQNFDTLVGLMRGRVDALDNNYEKAMGKSFPGGIFSNKAKGIIQKLGTIDLGSNSLEKGSGSAPQQAIDFLKAHPEVKDQFKAKYGYIPGE